MKVISLDCGEERDRIFEEGMHMKREEGSSEDGEGEGEVEEKEEKEETEEVEEEEKEARFGEDSGGERLLRRAEDVKEEEREKGIMCPSMSPTRSSTIKMKHSFR
tara:strand:- start:217 stop:531 length:315 start_codon:yes stop_codon:yes gene_type:complete